MATETILVPDIGGAEGAEVIELLVAVGDEVSLEQGLIVLESDKASMEIPSSHAGTVVEVLVAVGDELAEGAGIVVLDVAASASAAPSAAPTETEPEPEPEPKPEPESAAAAAAPAEPAAAADAAGEQLVVVPDIGTDEAVEVIELSVSVGDTVAEGDSILVLESDKASMEVPAPFAGQVNKILVKEGDSVSQGDELMLFAVGGGTAAAAASAAAPARQAPVPAPTRAAPAPPAEPAAAPAAAATAAAASAAAAPTQEGMVYAGPAVRKLARELGVELARVKGSGPRDRVQKEDLHAFVQQALRSDSVAPTGGTGIPAIPAVDFGAFGEIETRPLTKMDKLTGANMQRSWLNVPHVTQFDDADISDLEEFRNSLKPEAERRGVKLTPMPFLLKACAIALRDNPKFRSALGADGETLVQRQYIHIGMAVDTPAGLVVPVIRDVDRKTLWELAEEVIVLAGKARDRKLMPADMQGGCFTISSLGNIGGKGFTPIVNAPEVGILGVSKASMQPVWDGAQFQPRNLLPLSLSYDHRVINGGDAGRFFTQLVAVLGDIRRLLL